MSAPSTIHESGTSGGPGQDAGAARWPRVTPLALFLVLLLAYVLIHVRLVVVLLLLALLFATVIEPVVLRLERRYIPRGAAILLVYAAVLVGLVLLVLLFAPSVSQEIRVFRDQAPDQLRRLEAGWQRSANPLLSGPGARALDRAVVAIQRPPSLGGAAITVLTRALALVIGALAVLATAFSYLLEKALLKRVVLDLVPAAARERVERVWLDIEFKVGAWLRGQLILGVIIGISATIFYGILRLPYWPLLGLLAGVTELVPILGPWVGGITAVVFALTKSWQQAVLVVVFILVRQGAVDYILVPKIMRGAVGLSPLTIFAALLAGTELLGLAGALLAIPLAAAIQVIIADALRARRAALGLDRAGPAGGWRWLRPTAGVRPVEPTSKTESGGDR